MTVEEKPILRRGRANDPEAVKKLQAELTEAGFDIGDDRLFGEVTQKAVRKFESENSLPSDGVVGPSVWDALDKAVKEASEKNKPHPVKQALHAVGQEAKELVTYMRGEAASVSDFREKMVENAKAALGDDNAHGKYSAGQDVFWCAGFDDTMRNKSWAQCGVHQDFIPVTTNLAARFGGIESSALHLDVFHKKGDGYKMQPGDSVIFKRDDPHNSDAGHVGIVESVDYKHNTFTYIAGNVPHHGGPIVSSSTASMADKSLIGTVDEGALYEKAREKQLAQDKANTPELHTALAMVLAPMPTPTAAPKEKSAPAQAK